MTATVTTTQADRHLANRLAHIEPFHVMEIASHARALEAQGRDIIHMEIGEPDFPTPQPVIDAAQTLLASGQIYYTSALGIRPLREAISGHYQRIHGLDIAPERIIVTAGGSAALLLTCALIVNRDDEILLTDPSYPCNRHFVRVMEGVPRTIAVGPDERYQFTADLIDRAWTAKTKGVLVASPSNPTGTSVREGELKRIVDCVASRDGVLISDETYAGLNYGRRPETVLAHTDDAFSVNSFSKYFNMTGWRLGWLVAPERHVRDLEKLAQNLYISPASLSQHAALACFTDAGYTIAEARRAEFETHRVLKLAFWQLALIGILVDDPRPSCRAPPQNRLTACAMQSLGFSCRNSTVGTFFEPLAAASYTVCVLAPPWFERCFAGPVERLWHHCVRHRAAGT